MSWCFQLPHGLWSSWGSDCCPSSSSGTLTVSEHAATHIYGGSDEVDGDSVLGSRDQAGVLYVDAQQRVGERGAVDRDPDDETLEVCLPRLVLIGHGLRQSVDPQGSVPGDPHGRGVQHAQVRV